MSRAILQQASLGRAVLRVGSRGSPGGTAAGVVGRGTRRFAVSTPGLHHEPVSSSYWRQQQAWYGGLAVAVAGSVSVLALLQLTSVEELFPSLVKEATSPKRIEDLYTFKSEESLGRGQFGTVSTATDKATGEVVAVKRVPRSRTTEKNFREEAEVHREVGSHPNVVGLKGVFADDDCWYVVMELARGGELFDRLTTEGVVLPADEVRSLLREMAGAVAYMHDRGIVHGDIKPENVLLTTPAVTAATTTAANGTGTATATAILTARTSDEPVGASSSSNEGAACRFVQAEQGLEKLEREGGGGSGLGKVLLADFGSSFRLREGSADGGKLVKEYTVAYSAPEVVENSPDVDHKADVWSLGVIAYVMVKGHHPFDPSSEADDDEISESIINSEPDWDGLDSQAAQLIRRMLARDPVDRPSAEEVLHSSWLCAPSAKQGQ